MAYDNQNIFAKILRAEMPSIKVYEDDKTLAFMDIMPQVDGHTLVIPKVEAETLFEAHHSQRRGQKVKVQMGNRLACLCPTQLKHHNTLGIKCLL